MVGRVLVTKAIILFIIFLLLIHLFRLSLTTRWSNIHRPPTKKTLLLLFREPVGKWHLFIIWHSYISHELCQICMLILWNRYERAMLQVRIRRAGCLSNISSVTSRTEDFLLLFVFSKFMLFSLTYYTLSFSSLWCHRRVLQWHISRWKSHARARQQLV